MMLIFFSDIYRSKYLSMLINMTSSFVTSKKLFIIIIIIIQKPLFIHYKENIHINKTNSTIKHLRALRRSSTNEKIIIECSRITQIIMGKIIQNKSL